MTTTIEWTEETWNPTTGCDRISAGCDNCYAATLAKRLKAMGSAKYQTDGDPRTSGPGFGVAVHPDTLTAPLHWRQPKRIFVNSMSDLFHARVPREFVARVFAIMAATPQHTYQVLTKRPDRMARIVNDLAWRSSVYLRESTLDLRGPARDIPPWPLPNVWLGTSVEDQKAADLRLPALLDTPAAVRWLSCEPLLGPVNLGQWLDRVEPDGHEYDQAVGNISWYRRRLGWVVVGGESGHRARPMHPDWARSLRDQCVDAEIPFFFKQWGNWVPPSQMPEDTFMSWDVENGTGAYDRDQPWRVGKKAAGRSLDGRTWDQYPAELAGVSR
ncbi:phage Gp37/Gp68 family protein [Micromonospora sp. NBRC 101691]|uniref:phage Gp37/Gp68 family protein n=1 Tax=Micromonospora sp. NBRC 101691 TaxID=3032198 RepID=UPI0024A2192F|nr:phage Gp37/Gp68 family protein [Micromonospora sp. NBRC 101691]GLY21662.1 hypothetical protein Misp04_13940 [Micromonospora sp. NBRC 101691]